MTGTLYSVEVQPQLPPQLHYLQIFANDLLYSWHRRTRGLFYRLDIQLWESCGHNPKVFLRRVSQEKLEAAVKDFAFMFDYQEVIDYYEAYRRSGLHHDLAGMLDPEKDLIAYFCAEYGFHESFPIYSGGLGILAGDHCKAASDLGLPFVGVGLLYRQGYFNQTIDGHGNQISTYTPNRFEDLPVEPAVDPNGKEVVVEIPLQNRTLQAKVWRARAGRISLYLLDTDIPENNESDRAITYQLYGGDKTTRIQQEIVLGIGGVRALRALGLRPSVWHINEGHAAFQILERCREFVSQGHAFDTALELTASATIFTTHTPVPAGHDYFGHDLMDYYLGGYMGQLGIDRSRFLGLGASEPNQNNFNMTALALHGSRFHNGVSRIHGMVASQMERSIWPDILPDENPMHYVTNGVHVPTFLAREFANLFEQRFREWRDNLRNPDYWRVLDALPDHRYWSLRQSIKAEMLEDICRRTRIQLKRNGASEVRINRMLHMISEPERDLLIVGFARRFATYKRANLLFQHREKLAALVNDPERPVVFIFAGKAHPADEPGKQLIREIWELSNQPEFIGKILILEGYDMALARQLVSGCDIWLNTPEYPLEASGTSGQKAGVNGVLNLSVLDGWWGEGYNGDNGWAVVPHGPEYDPAYRNQEESSDLLELLKKQIVPLYYDRDKGSYSSGWVAKSKEAMRSILPRFNSERMVTDYVRGYYLPAMRKGRELATDGGVRAQKLSEWKQRIRRFWPGVQAQRMDQAVSTLLAENALKADVKVFLNGLDPHDITVEMQVGVLDESRQFDLNARYHFEPVGELENGWQRYHLEFTPSLPGLQYYRIRLFPYHPSLAHPYEMGFMRWL
ncbi:MAG: alpha-glucan family phosphorylase [Halothiobacillaceae bacterium]|jgi:starch phosphorylase|nr:alpha-glucan family phosphorylase [Halothiobacillaceae bacterium]MDY0050191.1 alpha-glucan family phosphorylase [Halothiobacillaceae bacterium]